MGEVGYGVDEFDSKNGSDKGSIRDVVVVSDPSSGMKPGTSNIGIERS